MNRKKLAVILGGVVIVAAAVCIVLFLKGRGGGEEEQAVPMEYTVEGEQIAALAVEKAVSVTTDASKEGGAVVYTYEGMTEPGQAVADYAAKLMEGESGFQVVDEDYVLTKAPDYTTEEGSVRLARDAQEEGKVLTLQVEWVGENCTITVDAPKGAVEEPAADGMNLMEAVDYLRGFSPAELGLSGSSMNQYQVYALDGTVFVDNQPCLQLSVYSAENPERTNDFSSSYLITGDKRHIYRFDKANGIVEELDI